MLKPYYQDQSVTIYLGDCLEVLKAMPTGSIHCCVTSPPYGNLRSYGGFLWGFSSVAMELYRVLSPGGVLCWNVGDEVVDGSETLEPLRQALYFTDDCGFNMHDTMIYYKCNFSNPEKVRYHQLFEYVFILSKGSPRTFNPIKDKRNKYNGPWGKNTYRAKDGKMIERDIAESKEFGMRGNVWYGETRGQEEGCSSLPHPAMMPKWLARDLIYSWSNAGDTVLDPFGGSGTTAKMALEIGRKAVLIDLKEEYVELAKDESNVTRGLGLPNPSPVKPTPTAELAL